MTAAITPPGHCLGGAQKKSQIGGLAHHPWVITQPIAAQESSNSVFLSCAPSFHNSTNTTPPLLIEPPLPRAIKPDWHTPRPKDRSACLWKPLPGKTRGHLNLRLGRRPNFRQRQQAQTGASSKSILPWWVGGEGSGPKKTFFGMFLKPALPTPLPKTFSQAPSAQMIERGLRRLIWRAKVTCPPHTHIPRPP